MIVSEYIERLRRLLMEQNIVANVADIEATAPLALVGLGEKRKGSHGFQKDFTVPMVSGSASLAAETSMFKDTIALVKHPDLDGVEDYFTRLPNGADRADLRVPRLDFYWYYVLINDSVEAMRGDGQTLPPDGDVTVTADSVPTIAEVTDEDDKSDLIAIGATFYVPNAEAA